MPIFSPDLRRVTMSFSRPLCATLLFLPLLLWSCTTMPSHDPNAPARATIGERNTMTTPAGATLVWYELEAEGSAQAPIIMFPSAGRETSDFNELASRLNKEGYPVWLVQHSGIDGAKASVAAPSLMDLGEDASQLVSRAPGKPVLLGHAFGNRLARATGARSSGKASGIILLAAGGLKPIPEKANEALINSFRPDLSPEVHKAAVRYGFFAEGNEIPDYWLRGWHAGPAQMQGRAVAMTDTGDWWTAGGLPMLVVTGLQDKIAPPEDTIDILESEFEGRVTGVRIEGAGHALLPEKPDEIADAILSWLEDRP